MAKGNQKAKSDAKRTYNTDRPNRKAWKRRACGLRHAPAPCPKCP